MFIAVYSQKQKVETIHTSINRWMDKQKNKMWNIHSILLFSHEKEFNSDTCYNMEEPRKHNTKWNKLGTKGQILYNSIYIRLLDWVFIETECKKLSGNVELTFNVYRVSVGDDDNILDKDGGNSCRTTRMYFNATKLNT